jgi:hypothetical protein
VRIALTHQDFELSQDAHTLLTDKRHLSVDTIELVELVMGELIEVAAGVGRDYDEDEGDDANLAGLLCSGRTRNRVARRIRSGEVNESREIDVVGSGLSTLLRAGGTEVHPYSCGSSEAPVLTGSNTKERVLKEGYEQLALFNEVGSLGKPAHVVVAYSRDMQGVTSAKVGMMSGREEFAWEVPIYARSDEGASGIGAEDSPKPTQPSHDQQHVDEPDVKLRRRDAQEER